jgi:hypothetical protein
MLAFGTTTNAPVLAAFTSQKSFTFAENVFKEQQYAFQTAIARLIFLHLFLINKNTQSQLTMRLSAKTP